MRLLSSVGENTYVPIKAPKQAQYLLAPGIVGGCSNGACPAPLQRCNGLQYLQGFGAAPGRVGEGSWKINQLSQQPELIEKINVGAPHRVADGIAWPSRP